MKITPSHSVIIEEKPLWVFDGLCSPQELNNIYKGLEISAFKRIEIARPDTSNFKHWVVNLSEQQIQNLPVYQKALSLANALLGGEWRAYRGYINHAAYGDMLFTHTDCMPDADELTVLIYMMPQWDIEWGGETLFFNNQDDCMFACTPKPGRMTMFHGAIKHVGRPPNRICYAPRYTLAFKLEKVN
ncbi:2OG-Fe(II) oxygenase [Alteromonas ponticola]|uniref:2OG-Fe(II) oxygenase n=1 Tax=Alteromonas aquimaris TaxID=2998417 RepID=A0ABT3P4J2_9ALTE|nr:2OG-Fe(II) oxygenase [Alteromonas aquimaris]MCW8107684.1 2OG-Fe(II) oxygenase [Alteromonas aquimaris]